MLRQAKVSNVCGAIVSDWAAKAMTWRAAGIGLVAVLAAWTALGVAPAAASTMVSPGASLLEPLPRVHPDPALSLGAPDKLNVFTDPIMPPEWVLEAEHAGTPHEGTLDVAILTQVWRHDDGHLLFAYQVQNLATSTSDIRRGNLIGYEAACEVIDSGIMDLGGDVEFDQGDILSLRRSNGSESQLRFAFEGTGTMGETILRMLAPGQSSSWFYAETPWQGYTWSISTVQDSGQSAKGMEVFVPHPDPGVPEPATMGLMGAGLVTMLMVRRRRRAA